MKCEEAREGISAILDGALAERDRRAVEAHAASCAECRAWREGVSDVRALLRGVDDLDEGPSRAAAVGKGVLARIGNGRLRKKLDVRRTLSAAGVMAVLAMIALGISWHYWPRQKLPRGADPHHAGAPAGSSKLPVVPKPPPPVPAFQAHLDMRADDAETRDALRELFKKWPATSAPSDVAGGEGFALAVAFEGPDDGAADKFMDSLRAFQRDHAGSIREWNLNSSSH